MQLFDQVIFPDNMRNDISGSTFILEQGGHIHAVLGDTASGGAVGYELAANGLISSMISYDLPIHVGDSGPVIATSAQGYIYTMTAEGQLQGFREEPGGYRAVTSHIDTAASYANDPVALEVVSSGGVEYLIALCGTDVGISAFGIDPQTGTLSHVSAVGTNTGVGLLSNPTDMQTVIIGDATYILVTSAAEGGQAGALTVVELGPDGEMQVTDHILDSRDTRFGSAHTLEITQVGGWTYVVTGGGDAGLSLFALMPMGRLLHLDTIEDTISAGLETISALSLFAAANTLHVFAASQASQGLAQLSVDLSQQGQVLEVGAGRLDGQGRNDLLIGGTGDNDLRGFGGNDTLVDGHGSDTLTGGTGADTFVFGADGQRDEIRDFEAGIDRIDLSAVPMMYDASRLSVVEQSWGATLIIPGNEQIEIRSADGGRLIVDQIFASLDWETDRPPLILLNEEAIDEGTNVLIDGDGSTVLEGSSAGDTIQGMGGNDTISGMGGRLAGRGEGQRRASWWRWRRPFGWWYRQ